MSLANGPTAAFQSLVHSLIISYQLTPTLVSTPMQLREIVTPSLGNHFPFPASPSLMDPLSHGNNRQILAAHMEASSLLPFTGPSAVL